MEEGHGRTFPSDSLGLHPIVATREQVIERVTPWPVFDLAPQNVSLSEALLMQKGREDDEVKAGKPGDLHHVYRSAPIR